VAGGIFLAVLRRLRSVADLLADLLADLAFCARQP